MGKEIDLLRQIGIPMAILTNASLIWHEGVKENLHKIDFVSLKIDAVSERLWRRINRSHRSLKLNKILDVMVEFSKRFRGITATETMLIDGVDYTDELDKIGEFLIELRPNKAYIAIPTRPPAESWVKPAKEELVNKAFQTFVKKLGQERVEYLIGHEGDAFTGLAYTLIHELSECLVLADAGEIGGRLALRVTNKAESPNFVAMAVPFSISSLDRYLCN